MPTIDRIKISQEINFNGLPTWIGIEASLLPGEDEKEGLRTIQKAITDYHQEEAKAYSQSRWKVKPDNEIPDNNSEVDAEKKVKLTKVERQMKCITDTTTLDGSDGLKSFALLVKNNQHLQETYNNHFQKLQNGL